MYLPGPLFQGIALTEAEYLIKCLQGIRKTYFKKDIVISEGEIPFHVGIVLNGSVEISTMDVWGNIYLLEVLKTGAVFAESFALSQQVSTVSVQANENTEILFLDLRMLTHPCGKGCEHHQRLLSNLIAVLTRKNILLTNKMQILSQKTIREKLLAYFTQLAKTNNANHFRLPLSKQSLAAYLSVNRSALSRELSKMQAEKVITIKNKEVWINQSSS